MNYSYMNYLYEMEAHLEAIVWLLVGFIILFITMGVIVCSKLNRITYLLSIYEDDEDEDDGPDDDDPEKIVIKDPEQSLIVSFPERKRANAKAN